MKLLKGDSIVVIAGRDKGKTGQILVVIPATGKVVVEGINIAKRHTKPDAKNPRGGILEIPKPMATAKVMVIDPITKQPARIGYEMSKDGTKKLRVFKPVKLTLTKAKPAKTEAKVEKSDKVEKTDAKKEVGA